MNRIRPLYIGILGTRGVPNRYGGFEQCAAALSVGLQERGHRVAVYSSSNHDYQQPIWNGVQIIHQYDPESRVGAVGQFVYDLNCILDARKRRFDVLLQLGYTSSSIWHPLWPKKAVNMVNMDGLEWMRSKYSARVQAFLKHAEAWAARHADALVADSPAIQTHLLKTHKRESTFIPYGAPVFREPDATVLSSIGVVPFQYYLILARMEPENNIETIIRGYCASAEAWPMLVVGHVDRGYGARLVAKYRNHPQVRFMGGIYDLRVIDNLRYYASLYFHGHSVGGTNPSLLEAMGCSALIAAHNNPFNRAILGNEAYYFDQEADVAGLIKHYKKEDSTHWRASNLEKVRSTYSWPQVVDQYEALMLRLSGRS